MDGLLIGLSSVAGQSAGLIMSIALTIEMAFLGVTFSAGVNKVCVECEQRSPARF